MGKELYNRAIEVIQEVIYSLDEDDFSDEIETLSSTIEVLQDLIEGEERSNYFHKR